MKTAIRFPHALAPGCPALVKEVLAESGQAMHAGDALLALDCGGEEMWFIAEAAGEIKDIRVEAGDKLKPNTLLFWIETQGPMAEFASFGVAANGGGGLSFTPSPRLLSPERCRLAEVKAMAGAIVSGGDAIIQYSCGPLLLRQLAATSAQLGKCLVKAGDALSPGTPLFALLSASAPAADRAEPAVQAAASRKKVRMAGVAEYQLTLRTLDPAIEKLRSLAAGLGMKASAEALAAEWRRAVENRFRIAVIGEFNRGKSTFLNALVGQPILPNDSLPCTAVPVRFVYGETASIAKVKHSGATESSAAAPSEIAARLREIGTGTDKAHDLSEVVVSMPLALCREGAELIDTPGLNESEAMTRVTFGVVPNSNAIIFLLSAEQPVSDTELAVVTRHLGASDVRRILFVVNAKDRMAAHDFERALAYIRRRLEQALKESGIKPPVFAVSSRDELAGQPGSGFAELREALDRFFFDERGAILLEGLAHAADATLRDCENVIGFERRRVEAGEERIRLAKAELRSLRQEVGRRATPLRVAILEAQSRLEAACKPVIGQLQLALLALASSVPAGTPVGDWIGLETSELRKHLQDRIDEAIGAEFQKYYPMLRNRAESEINPADQAVADLARSFAQAIRGAMARISKTDGREDGPAFEAGRFSGLRVSFQFPWIEVNLSLMALASKRMAQAALDMFGYNEYTLGLRADSIESVRANMRSEMYSRISAGASEASLIAKLQPDLRRPFLELVARLNAGVERLERVADENLELLDQETGDLAAHDASEQELAGLRERIDMAICQ